MLILLSFIEYWAEIKLKLNFLTNNEHNSGIIYQNDFKNDFEKTKRVGIFFKYYY